MSCRKIFGAALVDYVIPTVIIGLIVGLGIYAMAKDNKILNFLAASGNMKVDLNEGYAVMGSTSNTGYNGKSGGSMGGTPTNPVMQCNAGVCTIDYGEFLLNGIPENFQDFVQSGGTSGGTEKLTSLINQIADSVKGQGLPQEALDIKKLASIGHNIALMEKEVEKRYNSCNNNTTCANNINLDAGSFSLFDPLKASGTFDETYYPWPTNTDSSLITQTYAPGSQRRNQAAGEDGNAQYQADYEQALSNYNPSALFVDKYQSLMKTNISDTTKGVLTELYWRIGRLAENVSGGQGTYATNANVIADNYSDPLTGHMIRHGNGDIPKENPLDVFSNYIPLTQANLGDALICSAGYIGVSCHASGDNML